MIVYTRRFLFALILCKQKSFMFYSRLRKQIGSESEFIFLFLPYSRLSYTLSTCKYVLFQSNLDKCGCPYVGHLKILDILVPPRYRIIDFGPSRVPFCLL